MRSLAAATTLRILAALSLAVLPASAAAAAHPWSLLPKPAEVRPAAGPPMQVADGSSVAVRGADRQQVLNIAERFTQLVADARGLKLRIATAAEAHAAITFEVDPRADVVGEAGYRIVVDDHGILVSARTPQGVFYGSVSVWQLLTLPG